MESLRLPSTGSVARIATPAGWPRVDLLELWAYRGLFYFLVWRDVKARYAQTVLGAAWAVLQPVFSMVVFTVVFGRFARVPSEGAPYSAFALVALVPWYFFSTALTWSSNSLVGSVQLITKVYFPRLILPFSAVLASLMDFAIALCVLLAVLLSFGFVPAMEALVVVPLLTIILITTAAGAGFVLSALNVQYRDVKHAVPFLMQVWMFASPIVYPLSLVPAEYRPLYMINPLAAVMTGFRAVLLRTGPVPWSDIGMAMAVSLVLLAAGGIYFRRTEDSFADVA